jgi:TetR/AcrR family transcriptional repressor of lmrAB and yxaGH operons
MGPRSDTRERMVEAAYTLFRIHGYHGTSLADITNAAGCPRGSFSFHFPGGKTEVAHEVVNLAGERVGATITGLAESGEGLGALFDAAARNLRESDYGLGCAVAGVTLDIGDVALVELSRDCGAALTAWARALQPIVRDAGVPERQALRVARVVVMLLEGGIVVSRAQRDTKPLREARDAAIEYVEAARR